MTNEKRALDYFGGFDAFQIRANALIRHGLKTLLPRLQNTKFDLRSLEELIGFNIDLKAYLDNGQDIIWDMHQYERLCCPLEISSNEVLVKPQIPEEDKPYWNKKREQEFACSAAPTKDDDDHLRGYLFQIAIDDIDEIAEQRRALAA